MNPPAPPADHPPSLKLRRTGPDTPFGKKTGVLLVNLGTPEAPTAKALRPYLREFLSDPRVVELPRWLWIPLLYGVIVPLRAPKSAHAYAKIWDRKENASPLRVITAAQAAKLQRRLGTDISVRYAMRYGQPNIPALLDEMKAEGCGRIVVAPLYPQYAGATVGTVVDQVADWLKAQRWQPNVRVMAPYYDHPAYIKALAESVRARVKAANGKPGVIVASFHGLPLRVCEQGDLYYCHCHKTARLLAEELGVAFCKTIKEVLAAKAPGGIPPVLLTFQSRFGKAEWLQPYMAEVLAALPGVGIKDALAICPAFAADCVETLEEIAIAGKETFVAAGGKRFGVVPCLNDSPGGMGVIEGLVRGELDQAR